MRVPALLAPWLLLGLAACDGGTDGKDTHVPPDSGDTDTHDTDTHETDDSGDPDETGAADTTPPTITLTSPVDGATLSGATTLAAAASDDRGVAGVTFTVDGDTLTVDGAEPWTADWDTAALVNGNYRLAATAADAAGNAASAEAGVIVENGGPSASTVRIFTPVDGATLCGDVTVEAAVAEEAEEVAFSLDGSVVATDGGSPFRWEWDTLGATNGSHALRATATLADGGLVQNTIVVTVANTGDACDNLPSITLTAPDDGGYGSGTVAITAAASDDAGVLKVQFFVDNGLLVEDGSIPYGVDWDTDAFDEGPHAVKAIAYDTADQAAETRAAFTIDRTPPLVEITDPGAGILDGTVTVAADVTEAYALDSVVLTIDGSPQATLTEPPFEWTWDTTLSDYGSHALEVIAVDAAGHVGVDTRTVGVDNAPAVTITAPADGATVSGLVALAASAVDDGYVDTVEATVDGTGGVVDRSAPFAWDWDTCAVASGSHTLDVLATDNGGGTATDTITVTVDQAPEVALLGPSGAVDGIETLAAQAADDETILQVAWDVDGVVVATEASTSADPTRSCSLTCADDCDYYAADLDVATLDEGSHTLTVTVTDAAGDSVSDSTSIIVRYDQDGDGADGEAYGGDDCDDGDATVSPAAAEACDGADQDCDGVADEGFDADGDGSYSAALCPSSFGDDCDDGDPTVLPGATEVCDGVDNDCDGLVDQYEAESWAEPTFGSTATSISRTDEWRGNVYTVEENTTLASFEAWLGGIYYTQLEWRVYESTTSTGTYTLVASTSVYEVGTATGWYDSGALDVTLYAGRYYLIGVGANKLTDYFYYLGPSTPTVDGVASLGIDEDGTTPTPATMSGGPQVGGLFYQRLTVGGLATDDRDDDADGYSPFCGDCDDADADRYDAATEVCDGVDNDCDDADPVVHAGAVEACDGLDDDCDGAPDATEVDVDGDGVRMCDDDCDDGDPAVSPYATETCNAIDDDCDGTIDDSATDGTAYYADADLDGYGDPGTTDRFCDTTSGWVSDATDCDDTDAAVSPAGTEVCDDVDDDCDGTVDEGTDADGDGWSICYDCDDADLDVSPGAAETCGDAIDDDCDGYAPMCQATGSFSLSRATARYTGESSGDDAGRGLAVGDFDGDGDADVLVGAPYDDDVGTNGGALYLLPGPTFTSRALSGADIKILGESSSDDAGYSLATIPDADGDGADEVLVGAYTEGYSGTGSIYVVRGPVIADGSLSSAVQLSGESSNDNAGRTVAACRDCDGDGIPDLVTGATANDYYDKGAVYFVSGVPTADLGLGDADARLTGEHTDDFAGWSVDAGGDVDGDGLDDVLVSAHGEDTGGTGAGAAYLLLGPPASGTLATADLKLTGEDAGDWLRDVRIVGDTDGDGYDDLFVGAQQNDDGGTDAGAAWLVNGPRTGTLSLASADAKLVGEDAYDYAGNAGSAGDVDGDGHADLLLGALGADDGGSGAGVVYLQFGPIVGTLDLSAADLRIVGASAGGTVGEATNLGADLDADGRDDLAIGAPGVGYGATYLLFGEDL